MRKLLISIALLAMLGTTLPARGQQQGIGVGIIVGEPTGISLKSWLSPSQAFDVAAAWSFDRYESFQFQIDYVLHSNRLFQQSRLPVYYGVGSRFKVKDEHDHHGHDDHVGVRFPLGVTYLFQRHPLDLFFEVAPTLDVMPDTDVTVNGGMGMRFYF